MKSKFILYVIALLLLFNVVFQFKHGIQLNGLEERTQSSLNDLDAKISSLESSLRREVGDLKKKIDETNNQLQHKIVLLEGKTTVQDKNMGNRISNIEKQLAPPKKN